MAYQLRQVTTFVLLVLFLVSCYSDSPSTQIDVLTAEQNTADVNATSIRTEDLLIETTIDSHKDTSLSLHYVYEFNLPSHECSFTYHKISPIIFYTCPAQTLFAGLWAILPHNQSEAIHISSVSYFQPSPLLSPNKEFVALRSTQTSIQILSTTDWSLITEITIPEDPDYIQYQWLFDSSGIIITYPTEVDSLGILYLTGQLDILLSRYNYDNSHTHPDGGIEIFFLKNVYDNQNIFYTLSDSQNHPPKYNELYIYNSLTKESKMVFRDTEKIYVKSIIGYVAENELVVALSSKQEQNSVLGYYSINLQTQTLQLLYPSNPNQFFRVVGEFPHNNMVAVATDEKELVLIDFNNRAEINTNISCIHFFSTHWSFNGDYIVVFCSDSTWLFNLHSKQVKTYNQNVVSEFSGIWPWLEDEQQQMFVIQDDDTLSIISFE